MQPNTSLPVFDCEVTVGDETLKFKVRKASYAELLRSADKMRKSPTSSYDSQVDMILKFATHEDGSQFTKDEIAAIFDKDIDLGSEMADAVSENNGFDRLIKRNKEKNG